MRPAIRRRRTAWYRALALALLIGLAAPAGAEYAPEPRETDFPTWPQLVAWARCMLASFLDLGVKSIGGSGGHCGFYIRIDHE